MNTIFEYLNDETVLVEQKEVRIENDLIKEFECSLSLIWLYIIKPNDHDILAERKTNVMVICYLSTSIKHLPESREYYSTGTRVSSYGGDRYD